MTTWGLAWRTIVRDPTRAVLAVSGVAIIGALLFNMLLLSRGLLISFRDLLDTAGYDIRVVASEGLPTQRVPIPGAAALVADIGRLPEVQSVTVIRLGYASVTVAGQEPRAVGLIGTSDGAQRGVWRIVKGELPTAPQAATGGPEPIVISTRLAEAFHLEPGSALRLRTLLHGSASALPTVEFRVAAIGRFEFDAAEEFTVSTTMAGFEAAHGGTASNEADLVLVASRPGAEQAAAAAIARLRPDLHVYSNDQMVAQFNERGFAYFRQISTVLSAMTLAFAFLLVATLLTMSVNQRLGEVAALRALGFPRRRIAAGLLWESALLVGVGGACALPLGGVLAMVLDRILRAMPGVPERLHFFVFEPRAVLLHAGLLIATGVLASLYPIWLAARLPIAATLRREIVS